MKSSFSPGLVSVIVRMHSPSTFLELSRCLLSLVFQQNQYLEIIIVTQRFSEDDLSTARTHVGRLMQLRPDISWDFVNYSRPHPADARGRLLSLGLSKADGQFVYFLDYDDWIYPTAVEEFLRKFAELPTVGVVFGNVDKYNAEMHIGFVYLLSKCEHQFRYRDVEALMKGNFAPIHSYMYNRGVIEPALMYIDPHLRIEEDYELLLRVTAECAVAYLDPNFVVGVYAIKTDGSNTVGHGLQERDKLDYHSTVELINARKKLIALRSA